MNEKHIYIFEQNYICKKYGHNIKITNRSSNLPAQFLSPARMGRGEKGRTFREGRDMDKQDIRQPDDRFFEENPLAEDSIVRNQILSMAMLSNLLEYRGQNSDVLKRFDENLSEEMRCERERIASLPPEKLGDLLRKLAFRENAMTLITRIMENQEAAMPVILKKYLSSGYENYIIRAIGIFYVCDPVYTEELYLAYDQIRNPLACSLACTLFGMRLCGVEAFLLKEYRESQFTRYGDGPLAGLYCATGRLNTWLEERLREIQRTGV